MSQLPLPAWLLRWMSIDVDGIAGGSARVQFARFPEGDWGLLAVLAVLAVLVAVAFTYFREGRIAAWKKIALAGIRSLLFLVLALIVFYPVLEIDRERTLRAVTLVLVDESLSTEIADRYRGAAADAERTAAALGSKAAPLSASDVTTSTRSELIERLLEHPELRFLERLRERNRVEVFTFADDLRRLRAVADEDSPGGTSAAGTGTGTAVPAARAGAPVPAPPPAKVELTPRGSATDIASAIRGAAEQQGGSRIASIVLISDGNVTSGESLGGVRRWLAERGIPIHTIGVGDPSDPKNLRLHTVLASERVFAGDPVAVDVRVHQRGYGGETVLVELVDQPPGGAAPRVLTSEEIRFEDGNNEGAARFQVDLEGLGKHRLSARIAVREEEAFADDNERSVEVELIEEASRVLLIAGAPSYEYRFLQNLLRRDRRVSVSAWLMSADADFPQEGNISLKRLPTEPKELFAYDVVILVDPDPDGLPGGYAAMLSELVAKQNAGLVYVAGEKYSVRFFRSETMRPLRELLPLVPDITRAESEGGPNSVSVREWPLVPTVAAATHSATRLSSRPDRNRERWSELSGIYWAFRIRKSKPGASVLLVHSDPSRVGESGPEPILAWQYYEGGRSFFLSSDETWRWRATTEEIYDQFWMQTVRYLTEGRLTGGKRRLIQTDRDAYELGEVARVSALVQDESFRPYEGEVRLEITHPDAGSEEVLLEADSGSPGWFRGLIVPRALGDHTIRIAGDPQSPVTTLRVELPDIELAEPQLDEASLRELAGALAPSRAEDDAPSPGAGTGPEPGGAGGVVDAPERKTRETDAIARGSYGRIWEAGAVPDRIESESQTITTTDEPIPLWDNRLAMAILASLLTLEWVLRKLCRLL